MFAIEAKLDLTVMSFQLGLRGLNIRTNGSLNNRWAMKLLCLTFSLLAVVIVSPSPGAILHRAEATVLMKRLAGV
ncbi:MAG: hypothetical protein ABSH34_03600 [Verrucomicrobiota bacterium]|jgi:hypothetical protein